jgi:hypothetical protein
MMILIIGGASDDPIGRPATTFAQRSKAHTLAFTRSAKDEGVGG